MAKADPPKKREPKYGTAAATGAGYGVMSGAKKAKTGFKPYNKETTFQKRSVPRTIVAETPEGLKEKYFKTATQRVSTTKSYSKLGVVTKSTLTETIDGIRKGTRSTTLSPRGKLKGLGQVVIQETKPEEFAGRSYAQQSGKQFKQGGKYDSKGKYKTKSITYAKEGYPTPKKGRVPKAGNPVVSSLTRQTQLTGKYNYIIEKPYEYLDDTYKTVLAETKTKNIYKTLVAPQTRAGQFIQSKSAAQLFSAASGAAKVAGKIIGAGNIVGTAVLAYDAMKWSKQWHEDNPNANKEKYKNYSFNK